MLSAFRTFALGTWHLALDTWHLALGTWHLALRLSGVSLRCAPGRAARAAGHGTTGPSCAEPPAQTATVLLWPLAPGSRPSGRASLTRTARLTPQRRPVLGPARGPHPPAPSPVRPLQLGLNLRACTGEGENPSHPAPTRCLPEGLPRRSPRRRPPSHRDGRQGLLQTHFFRTRPGLPFQPPPGVFGGGGRVMRARWGRSAPRRPPAPVRSPGLPFSLPHAVQFVGEGRGGGRPARAPHPSIRSILRSHPVNPASQTARFRANRRSVQSVTSAA